MNEELWTVKVQIAKNINEIADIYRYVPDVPVVGYMTELKPDTDTFIPEIRERLRIKELEDENTQLRHRKRELLRARAN